MTDKLLLPIDQILNHDGHDLKILRRLDSGLTGEVYEGMLSLTEKGTPLRVAIKVMKALDFPMARQFFLQESETLAFLMHLEEEANKEQRLKLKIAPIYYGRGEYEGNPYIVMEFIDGVKIPSLLEKQGVLGEKHALTIAWHLYRTLDILHTRIQRTYIDLKFENLWWVSDPEGQLKLTDFGTLEPIKPTDTFQRGVRRDLLLGGVYLFQMLSGRMLKYSLGELGEPARPLIYNPEYQITWGTRRLLSRILHRNPGSRPKSAASIASELRSLVLFWNQAEERLYSIIQNNLAEAESAAEQARAKKQPLSRQGLDSAIRARGALDIYHSLYPSKEIANDIQRAEAVLKIGDYLERGTALLQGRSFAMARQVFEEGIQWSDDPALLRRWAFLARAGEQISPNTFAERYEEAVQALKAMAGGQWKIALERLDILGKPRQDGLPGYESDGLRYLISEAEFFSKLEQAESARSAGDYSLAATLYKSALSELRKLPDAEARFIINEEVGDISVIIDEMSKMAETREQAAKYYKDAYMAINKGEWDKAVDLAWKAFLADRGAPFRHQELEHLARASWEQGIKKPDRFRDAVRASRNISAIGTWEAPMDPALARTWHLAVDFDRAVSALELGDGLGLIEAVSHAWSEAAADEVIQPLTAALLARAEKFAQSNPGLLRALATIFKDVLEDEKTAAGLSEKASQVETDLLAKRAEEIDKRLQQVRFLLALISPDTGRLTSLLEQAAAGAMVWKGIDLALMHDRLGWLEEARQRLVEIRSLSPVKSEQQQEVDRLNAAVEAGIQATHKAILSQQEAQRELRKKQIAALSAERLEIDSLRQWARQAAKANVDPKAQELVQIQLRDRLVDFLYRCYQVLNGEPASQVEATLRQEKFEKLGWVHEDLDPIGTVRALAEWATHSIDELGTQAWEEVKKLADEHQKSIEAGLEPASRYFEHGDLTKLSAELDRTEAEYSTNLEWQALKKDFLKVSVWKAWLDNQAQRFEEGKPDLALLRDLRDFLLLDLPKLYWQQSPVPAYLKKAHETARQTAVQLLKKREDANQDEEIVEALRAWLSLEWTNQISRGVQPSSKAINRMNWMLALQRGASLEQATPQLPENPDQELAALSAAEWQAVRNQEREAREAARRRQKSAQRIAIGTGIGFILLLVLGISGFAIYKANQDAIWQALYGTCTPTITNTLTTTPTSTNTPTPTTTPTLTPTPTPIPPSNLLLAAPETLYPVIPVAYESAWLFNLEKRTDPTLDPLIQVSPPLSDQATWSRDFSPDTKSRGDILFYTNTGGVTVQWKMDQPFNRGTYAVYIIDTVKASSGSYPVNVLLDDAVVAPLRGLGSITFQHNGQKNDNWLLVGIYEVLDGQRMSIQISAGPLTAETPFALDRLLIVKLNEDQTQMVELLPVNRGLVSLLDDDRALFYELVSGKPVQVLNRGEEYSDILSWGDSLLSRSLNPALNVPLWVEWQGTGQQTAGLYEVYVWVPALHASVQANYVLLLDGKPIQFDGSEIRPDTGPEDFLRPLNQNDHSGVWYSLGVWTLQTPGTVGMRMIVPENTTGEVCVDAIAIVKVDE